MTVLPENTAFDAATADFKKQVAIGLKELDEGKGIPHEDVKKRMARWLTDSNGLK